jgi:AcrR family transcriptional regulator
MESVKDRIIQGATEMFFTQGIKAVTMDDIANNLGMSKRTIYENFGDKMLLLKACLKGYSCNKQKELSERSHLSVVEQLYTALKKTGANMVEHNREFRLFHEVKKYYPELYREAAQEVLEKQLEMISLYVERGKREGIFLASANAEIAANIQVAQMDMFANSDRVATATDIVELMRNVSIIFCRGISTPEGIAKIDAMLEKLENETKQK